MKQSLFIILLSFIACRSVLEEVQLENEAKYTVSCFISPQDTISLFLGLSFPLNKVIDNAANNDKIKQAEVFISNEKGEKIKLDFQTKSKIFSAKDKIFSVENGKRYNLFIKTVEGKILKSECIIPSAAPDFSINIDSLEGLFYIQYQWLDRSETNYYRCYGWKRPLLFPAQSHEIVWTDGSQIATQLVSDENKNGITLYSNRADTQKKNDGFASTGFNTYIDAALLNIDKHYYEFQRSLEKSQTSNNFEPTPTFSNIEGGLGIFSGCDILRKTVRIR